MLKCIAYLYRFYKLQCDKNVQKRKMPGPKLMIFNNKLNNYKSLV